MKKKFSIAWKASKQPRKQRKYRINSPTHIKRKLMCTNLNKDLRKKYNRRSFPLKKGDIIKIMRGKFKNKTGKIELVDLKKLRVTVDGIYNTKKDGTKVNVYFDPSNLQIKELNLEDKKRRDVLEKTKRQGDEIKNTNEETKEKKHKETKNALKEK
jgi:large subunit ribosomal protein L24